MDAIPFSIWRHRCSVSTSDAEPRNASRREAVVTLFDQIRLGIFNATTSPRTVLELNQAAEPLRARLLSLLADVTLLDADDTETERLAAAYLRETENRNCELARGLSASAYPYAGGGTQV